MKKSLFLKVIALFVLLIIGLISINYSRSYNSEKVASSESGERYAGGSYDLYITGVNLEKGQIDTVNNEPVYGSAYICVYTADTLDDHKCDIKADYQNMEGLDRLKVTVGDIDATYYYDLYTFDGCEKKFEKNSGGLLPTQKDGEILIAHLHDTTTVLGDQNLWCDGNKYSTAKLGVYKYWYDTPNQYVYRPSTIYYYIGSYENGEYHVDRSTEIATSVSKTSSYIGYKYFNNLSTLQEYVLYESFDTIDYYDCAKDYTYYLQSYDSVGTKVEIDGVKYCAFKFKMSGSSDVSYFDIRNTLKSDLDNLKTYTIQKVWDDNNNQDGKRPTYGLYSYVYLGNTSLYSLYLYENFSWKGTVKLAEKYLDGTPVNYTFKDNISSYVSSFEIDDEYNVTLKNTHTPIKTQVTVTNQWKDLIGESPDKVEVNLLRNGEVVGFVELNEENNWTYTFEVDKYYNGSLATYGVQQAAIEGFDLEVKGNYTSGFTLINTQTGEFRKVKIMMESVCGSGTITGSETITYGSDSSPNAIVITAEDEYYIDYIKVNGEKIQIDEKITSYVMDQFRNLEEDVIISVCFKRFDGKVLGVTYLGNIVNNPKTKVGIFSTTLILGLLATGAFVAQSVSKKDFTKNGFNLAITTAVVVISVLSLTTVARTNKMEETEVAALEKSVDPELSPLYIIGYKLTDARIKIKSYSSGEEYYLTSADHLSNYDYMYKIDLPVDETYSIEIQRVYCIDKRYETERTYSITMETGNNFIVYNYVTYPTAISLTCEKDYYTKVTAAKSWSDGGNQYNTRPDSIDMRIEYYYKDLSGAQFTGEDSCTMTADTNWTCEFEKDDEYRTLRSENSRYGYMYEKMIYNNDKQYDTTERDYTCSGTMTDDGYCKIPITSSNKSTSESSTQTLDSIFHTFTANNSLVQVAGAEETHYKIQVNKVWDDNDNQDGMRYSYIYVYVNPSEGSFYNTSKYIYNDSGYIWINKNVDLSKINFVEGGISGYSNTEKVFDIDTMTLTLTNKHVPITMSVKVTKSWENIDPDEEIPESATVNLIADGVVIDTYELTAAEDWTHTFTDLPKYENGLPISYTVSEKLQEGYYVDITGSASAGYVITNEKIDETRRVHISTEVICGEGTITGDEELVYGTSSTPNIIVARGDENYAIEYVLINDEKRTMDELTRKYVLERFLNVTEDQTVKVCFYDAAEALSQINGGDEEPENPADDSERENPNTFDYIWLVAIISLVSLIVFIKTRKRINY